MRLYVAYGSNLHKREMRRRCPDAIAIGAFYMTDARLVFRGVADIEYAADQRVPCGLWRVSPQDEIALDRYEGVKGGFYYREMGIKIEYRKKVYSPLVYLMCSRGVYPPAEDYVARIRQGYRDFGLDQSYLDAAIVDSFNGKNPDEQTRARRVRQRNNPRLRKLVKMPEAVALRRLDLEAAAAAAAAVDTAEEERVYNQRRRNF